jgi:hypothetical protein
VLDPVQVSCGSHTPVEARQIVPPFPAGCWQVPLEPLHWSRVQGLLSLVHVVPLGLMTSAGQDVLDPVQVSCGSHTPVEARQVVPALPAGCWQAALEPSHWSRVQGLLSSVHAVPLGLMTSAGQDVLEPVQVSCGSHTPVEARQIVPPFPAGCWQVPLEPLHWSRVQGLLSLVHVVPLGLMTSVGQVVLEPVQVSCGSHSPVEARQVVPAFPAGCWQAALEPLHWSRVQGLLSLVHVVPLGLNRSAGQLPLEPVQVSCGSHSPAEVRQTWPDDLNVHVEVQHEPVVPFAAPSSHCSPARATPLPHTSALYVAIAAAHCWLLVFEPVAASIPVAETIQYSEFIVMFEFEVPPPVPGRAIRL